MSNGAMLCYRLACEMPDVFAAVAPVAGTMFDFTCAPSAPISLVAVNGTKDGQVAYEGGVGSRAFFKADGKPVPAVFQFWAERNGCKEKESRKIGDHVLVEARKGGKGGAEVVLYTVEGGGHAWPGGTRAPMKGEIASREINATDVVWEFFKAHPKKSS
jgi:polyhydroxybutyrate depolymerase